MVNSNLTEINIILDRSGSMTGIEKSMEDAMTEFIKGQSALPGELLVSLVKFDHEYEVVYTARPANEVPPFMLVPRGNTALLDAIGRTIHETGSRYAATPEEKRPGKVIFVIVTDGLENASKEWTRAKVKESIDRQRSQFAWEFFYFGANQDAVEVGKSMGIAEQKTSSFEATKSGVLRMGRITGQMVAEHRGS